jgi:PPM family protein phosphatase
MLARYTGVTDPGRRRRRNEDAYVCEPPLFAIADGMGGAQAGEVASGLAAAVLEEATSHEAGEAGEERVASLIREANRRVYRRSNEDAATSGMGTTMTVALVAGDGTIAFGHVGDSRAYRVRGGELEQLTDDHSLVGELVRSGRLSPEEAESHPQRAVITRALGTEPDVDVDTFTVEAEPDDIYLLCSDGLTDMISGGEILDLVGGSDDLEAAARALVNAANAGGGEDNITVVLFQIGDGEPGGETQQLPAAVAVEPEPEQEQEDDEDTLSPLDGVPAVDTAVIPVEAVHAELAREESRRRRRRDDGGRRVVPLVVLVLFLLALVALAVWGISR